jgi:hypothetical protein
LAPRPPHRTTTLPLSRRYARRPAHCSRPRPLSLPRAGARLPPALVGSPTRAFGCPHAGRPARGALLAPRPHTGRRRRSAAVTHSGQRPTLHLGRGRYPGRARMRRPPSLAPRRARSAVPTRDGRRAALFWLPGPIPVDAAARPPLRTAASTRCSTSAVIIISGGRVRVARPCWLPDARVRLSLRGTTSAWRSFSSPAPHRSTPPLSRRYAWRPAPGA